ncbi:biphenyl 2,3-dioxygenase [Burkholderia paludis]|uniref:Biphenyl 2,3-dioxygenase n=1 Tax=Burkholderia paludis TaxID=1506587 RepID=A0A6P2K3Z0_9BURK|nr:hypothetical protein [Burkholderia paludis]CAB3751913.1 hypothetical protein LMG30113_01566 [Burkholderia paludis]VWB51045.1 biphenyl 2,3-dioxygenase [Burkholderia paludis]
MIDVRALGYVVVEATRVDAWRRYAEDVLGMQALDAPGGALYLKMDERDFRYVIVPGAADRYAASGWELPDGAAFDAALAVLQRAGIEPVRATPGEAALRRVQAMAWCTDPSGNRHELYWGARCDFRRFVSPQGVAHFTGMHVHALAGTGGRGGAGEEPDPGRERAGCAAAGDVALSVVPGVADRGFVPVLSGRGGRARAGESSVSRIRA